MYIEVSLAPITSSYINIISSVYLKQIDVFFVISSYIAFRIVYLRHLPRHLSNGNVQVFNVRKANLT